MKTKAWIISPIIALAMTFFFSWLIDGNERGLAFFALFLIWDHRIMTILEKL